VFCEDAGEVAGVLPGRPDGILFFDAKMEDKAGSDNSDHDRPVQGADLWHGTQPLP
jgi:hypothetical protein